MNANHDHFGVAQMLLSNIADFNDVEEAQVHALLAIAQQLQIMNYRSRPLIARNIERQVRKEMQEGENID